MHDIKAKLLFICLYSLVLFQGKHSNLDARNNDINLNKVKNLEDIFRSQKDFINEISYKNTIREEKQKLFNKLFKDFNFTQAFFNILDSNKIASSYTNNKIVNIESDVQYDENNNFIAEGNVKIQFNNALITADKVIFNKEENSFLAIGSPKFEKGDQYIEGSEFFYDIKKDEGYINNAYGIINLESLSSDLQFGDVISQINMNNRESNVDQIEVFRSSTFGIDSINLEQKGVTDKLKEGKLNLNIESVISWRFKTNKINFSKKTWSSENIIFTNDIFNKPQFLFKSKNFFSRRKKDDTLVITSKGSRLIFDDILTIPIGRRSIDADNLEPVWGIGYEKANKDGLYIIRNFAPISIFENYSLKLKPEFLLQRAIQGETSSFTKKNSSITSKKVKTKTSFSDYFSLNTELRGDLFGYDLLFTTSSNSLDFDKSDRANRAYLSLSKTFDISKEAPETDGVDYFPIENKKINLKYFATFREDIPDYSGGSNELYAGFGAQAIYNYSSTYENLVKRDITFLSDLGKYYSEAINKSDIINDERLSFIGSLNYSFPIIKYKRDVQINEDYNFIPEPINQGVELIAKTTSGFYFYGDQSKQQFVNFKIGPKIIYGDFKKKYFDYTSFQTSLNYRKKSGDSPFKFDNIDTTTLLNFDFSQRLFGPILLSYRGDLNLDSDSADYGNIIRNVFTLNIQRRAYNIDMYYEIEDNKAGINFTIYNFKYKGRAKKF